MVGCVHSPVQLVIPKIHTVHERAFFLYYKVNFFLSSIFWSSVFLKKKKFFLLPLPSSPLTHPITISKKQKEKKKKKLGEQRIFYCSRIFLSYRAFPTTTTKKFLFFLKIVYRGLV